MAVGSFFSAAPTAQNSPELHFCFINYSIQPSLVGSLVIIILHVLTRKCKYSYLKYKWKLVLGPHVVIFDVAFVLSQTIQALKTNRKIFRPITPAKGTAKQTSSAILFENQHNSVTPKPEKKIKELITIKNHFVKSMMSFLSK